MNAHARILGLDPGSRCTGYGLIEMQGSQLHCITYGQIRTTNTDLKNRLQQIDETLRVIIADYQPHETAIEQVFTFHNHQSALKLGQARGAILVAIASFTLPVAEYSARQIKQAVTGYGNADKIQVQRMVQALLHLQKSPPTDAADALAVALCHANSRVLKKKLETIYRK